MAGEQGLSYCQLVGQHSFLGALLYSFFGRAIYRSLLSFFLARTVAISFRVMGSLDSLAPFSTFFSGIQSSVCFSAAFPRPF